MKTTPRPSDSLELARKTLDDCQAVIALEAFIKTTQREIDAIIAARPQPVQRGST